MDVERIAETWPGSPDVTDPGNAYHEGKRVAELMGNVASSTGRVDFVTARLFAFLAPFLPWGEHFAAGNFLRDAAQGDPIRIKSGGGSVRSYQYGTDMAVWTWALLARGERGRAYNVGSDSPVTIRELADVVVSVSGSTGGVSVEGVDTVANVSRYVPDVSEATSVLGLRNYVDLGEAVRRTLRWNGEQ